MSLLHNSSEVAPWALSSNYAGNGSGSRVSRYWEVSGSGVQRTTGWSGLSKLQKMLVMKNYYKSWLAEDRGFTSTTHTEKGPGQSLYKNEWGPYGSSVSNVIDLNPDVADQADYLALIKLFDSLKGEGANVANMIGERNQVLKSVVNAIHGTGNILLALKRGDIARAVRYAGGDPRSVRELRTKDIAGMWLALQYGWKPLLSDVYDLVNGLHYRETTFPKVHRGRKSIGEIKKPATGSSYFDSMKGPLRSQGVAENAAVVKYTVMAMPDAKWAAPAALGLTDPLTVLWEVTPWSFVVDWFIPVGQYLEQLTATHGWNFMAGCKSTLQRVETKGNFNGQNNYSSAGWSYTNTKSWRRSCVYTAYRRSVLNGFPSVRAPKFKNPFSTGHMWNSLALLYQAFGPTGRSSPPRFPKSKFFDWDSIHHS